MPTVHEHFSQQFQEWEKRGRGWKVFAEPISLEPPFKRFNPRSMTEPPTPVDDGRRPTFLSSFVQSLSRKLNPPVETTVAEPEEEEGETTTLPRENLTEFCASLPDKLDISKDVFEQFLLNLSLCRKPIAFELLGTHKKVSAQFVSGPADVPLMRRQLTSFFPEAAFIPSQNTLESAWNGTSGDEILAIEFGLEREFMFPLATGKLDPFVGIVGALGELQAGELGLFQVLWQPVRQSWRECITDSVTHSDGKPFFVNMPELASAAENKVSRPLFAAVVRIMVCAGEFERSLQLACDLAGALRVFANPNGNALIPLHNQDYGFEEHIDDVLRRQSRRSGMILNSEELMGFVHIPSTAVRSPVFQRQTAKTKAAPGIVRHKEGLLLGSNDHHGEMVDVRLTPEQRVQHAHIIGASGSGKSTLLFNLIKQSIDAGEGIACLDPHGDLINRILGEIPESRIKDVILIDPADEEYAIGFNILSAHSTIEKNLLASDLVAMFQRLSASWGDQMNSVFQNAVLAFLESDRGGTLADLRRFLIEPAFRNEFLKTVKDPEIVYYWQKSFPQLSGNKSIGSVLTRLDSFLAQKPIRHMVSQPVNRLDFASIMDTGKILLAKLPEGLLGRENAYLLGTLLVSKFQQIAMSRQAQQIESRRMFNIVIDEFASFITPSMAEILSGARKYRIGLTLAHQELHQLQRSPEVASAVMTHPFARIVFRVGDDDAKKLADGFSLFEAKDLKNLERGQAVCRVERSDFDFNLAVRLPVDPDKEKAKARRDAVITASRKEYGTSRAEIEALLAKSKTPPDEPPTASQAAPVKPKPPVAPTKPEPSSPQPKAPHRAAEAPPPSPPTSAELPKAPESPPVAEVPKQPAPLPESDAKPKQSEPSSEPRDLGRGGAQHQAIQKRLKEAAEECGFRCIIEKAVMGGTGSVDLWLERPGDCIACEISISNTIDYEVRNVGKCLKAGVPKVAMICTDEKRLRKIADAVSGSLGAEAAAHVGYFQPDQFILHLKQLPRELPAEDVRMSRGYKVTRVLSENAKDNQIQNEAAKVRAIAESMRRNK